MGDRGIPRTWRHMNGYSSHAYSWVSRAGQIYWVKYHFITDQGIEWLPQAEADILAGQDADCHQRHLWEAIRRGDRSSWTLHPGPRRGTGGARSAVAVGSERGRSAREDHRGPVPELSAARADSPPKSPASSGVSASCPSSEGRGGEAALEQRRRRKQPACLQCSRLQKTSKS